MLNEQYASMSVTALRALAKERGLRHLSGLKKSELIERLSADQNGESALQQNHSERRESEREQLQPEYMKSAPKVIEQKTVERSFENTSSREPLNDEPAQAVQYTDGSAESPQHAQRPVESPQHSGRSAENSQDAQTHPSLSSDQTFRRSRQNQQNDSESRQSERTSGERQRTPRTGERATRQASNARTGERPIRANQKTQYSERVQRQSQGQYQGQNQGESSQNGERSARPYAGSRQNQSTQSTQNTQNTRNMQSTSTTEQRSDRPPVDLASLDSGDTVEGVIEVMSDGYGFIRSNQYLSGENDVYVAPSQIRRFGLRTGDLISGNTRISSQAEKFRALLYVKTINGRIPAEGMKRPSFEQLTPIFPDHRIRLERSEKETAMRIVDLISPVGRGQRGMIVSPPKAGKTTLLKDIARSILQNEPDMHIMIMLIDERPEEVTDIKEAIVGDNVEVIYSTFDELPEHHMKVAEMGIERARRLVEYGEHVTILLDSITRLARAYNLTVQPSGRTLSGGLDPAALNMPKRFFGAARNMREGGSLTILATALIDTGSKMDDVVYEEFKGTGNMELVLDRKLSERRVFPAIDIQKSGTRREDLLLTPHEQEAVYIMRRALNGMKGDEAVENILNTFAHTSSNAELIARIRRQRTV